MKVKDNLNNFNHLEAEKRIYLEWEKKDLFSSKINSEKNSFSMIMPPPNVTGNLHIGHALNMTIQDILCRFWRMNGRNVLWQPGTDHAGIATQSIVEKNLLKEENLKKNSIGKEKFIAKVWEWKNASGDKIVNQIKRLGASPDWKRLKFTLDEDVSNAVNHVFINLYKDGLIYKDRRLVNWDTKLQTAISDLEVEQKEQSGNFFYIRYFLENSKQYITVATTRPETLFGDCCIAVNPKDKKYKNYIGKKVYIPLTKKLIPIIADSYVDIEKGTGALKVTPAHDFNDFKIGKRLKISFHEIFDKFGKFNDNVPAKYKGLDRLQARTVIISDLKKNANLEKIEKIIHSVPYGDRSGAIVEPYLTEQWFLDVKSLAKEAILKVKKNETEFIPKSWTKVFYSWMNQIEPWCISRQIWWGHQLPVWYGPDNKIFVCTDKKNAFDEAIKYYGKQVELKRETDVLDTWFSSSLWPLTTLGWPKITPVFKEYFPTNILVTGFDIIFFWVSRMMMQSLYNTKKVPFKKVYIHPLIRDQFGQKMSKSKGNIIDPLELINKYGADALRFTLASLASQGKDIKLSEESVKLNRNFVTKIFNSYKFLHINKCKFKNDFKLDSIEMGINKWIVNNLNAFIFSVTLNIKKLRFNDAVKEIYSFTKNIYCDWYIESIKVLLNEISDKKLRKEIQNCSSYCFSQLLKVCHPFIPFISDEIHFTKMSNNKYLDQVAWPEKINFKYKQSNLKNIDLSLGLISKIRNIKSSLKIEPKNTVTLFVDRKLTSKFINNETEIIISNLAKVKISFSILKKKHDEKYSKFIFKNIPFNIFYKYEDLPAISDSKDLLMMNKELDTFEFEIKRIETKLKNKSFLEKAPEKVVEINKKKLDKYNQSKNKLLDEISYLKKRRSHD